MVGGRGGRLSWGAWGESRPWWRGQPAGTAGHTKHPKQAAQRPAQPRAWWRRRLSRPNRNSMPSWSSTVMETCARRHGQKSVFVCEIALLSGGGQRRGDASTAAPASSRAPGEPDYATAGRAAAHSSAQQQRTGKKWLPALSCTMWMRPAGEGGRCVRPGMQSVSDARPFPGGQLAAEPGPLQGPSPSSPIPCSKLTSAPRILADPTPTAMPCHRRSMRRSRLQRSAQERLMMVIC